MTTQSPFNSPTSRIRRLEGNHMEEVSKTISEMQERIASKLKAAGANSKDNAVTIREANLDFLEQNWLNYIAGGLFALVKKTPDKRYYVATFFKKLWSDSLLIFF
jgi:hypothetical protein